MRRLATWLIFGFLGAVVVAATIAALVRNDDGDSAVRTDTSPSPPVRVPRCRAAQLALSIEMRSGRPVVVLRHVSGPSCDVGTLRIVTTVRDRRGERVLAQDTRGAFSGEISSDVEFIGGFVYTPFCNQKGPLVARVTVGDLDGGLVLVATRTVPIRGCLAPDPASA